MKAFLRILGIVVVAAAVIGTVTAIRAFQRTRRMMEDAVNRDTFYEGIWLDDLSLGGLTMEEAEGEMCQRTEARFAPVRLTVVYEGREWVYAASELEARSDYRERLEEAYAVGREGELKARYAVVQALLETPVRLTTTLLYEPEAIRETLVQLGGGFSGAAKDADIRFDADSWPYFFVTPDEAGFAVDAQALAAAGVSALAERRFDAVLDIADYVYAVPAAVQAAQLEGRYGLIASMSTDLGASSANRIHNIRLSSAAFHGMTVWPGQRVSFNGTTGERTTAKGYRTAPVIKGDKSLEDDVGGGVCQTSSTLYNAVLLSRLGIVQRSHHSYPLSYVATGLDATVNYPSLDFVFENTRDTPVFLRAYVAEHAVHFELYGIPDAEGVRYRLRSEVYATEPIPETVVVRDEGAQFVTYTDESHQKVKGRQGIRVYSYRERYENGALVDSERVADDYYQPIAPVIYVGVQARPVVAPAEEPVIPEGAIPLR